MNIVIISYLTGLCRFLIYLSIVRNLLCTYLMYLFHNREGIVKTRCFGALQVSVYHGQ